MEIETWENEGGAVAVENLKPRLAWKRVDSIMRDWLSGQRTTEETCVLLQAVQLQLYNRLIP